MNEKVIFNFGLLFDKSFSNELVEVSRSFGVQKKLDYLLGEDSLPHVTILQFPGILTDAEVLWRRLEKISMPPVQLHFHGLAFDRFRSWDGIWLRIKFCQELRNVQTEATSALGNLEYVNGLGELYEPHSTLAAWPKEDRLPNFQIPNDVLDRKGVPCHYTLGISGPNFQYQKCLFNKSAV